MLAALVVCLALAAVLLVLTLALLAPACSRCNAVSWDEYPLPGSNAGWRVCRVCSNKVYGPL